MILVELEGFLTLPFAKGQKHLSNASPRMLFAAGGTRFRFSVKTSTGTPLAGRDNALSLTTIADLNSNHWREPVVGQQELD
jgi:hypothetical protein